jgi:hypothetical protein
MFFLFNFIFFYPILLCFCSFFYLKGIIFLVYFSYSILLEFSSFFIYKKIVIIFNK